MKSSRHHSLVVQFAATVEPCERRRLLSVSLLADINTGVDLRAQPDDLVSMGAAIYYTHETGSAGRELIRSDGTAAGTAMVKDILPGPNGTTPIRLTVSGDKLFFVADDGESGRELWVSDGTAAGTFRLADIAPGDAHSDPVALVAGPGGSVYFFANDIVHGYELWRSDGTAAGTAIVGDLLPGPGGQDPFYANGAMVGSVFCFSSFGSDGVASVFRTSGMPGDIARFWTEPTPYEFLPLGLISTGSRLFFVSESAGLVASNMTAGTNTPIAGTSYDGLRGLWSVEETGDLFFARANGFVGKVAGGSTTSQGISMTGGFGMINAVYRVNGATLLLSDYQIFKLNVAGTQCTSIYNFNGRVYPDSGYVTGNSLYLASTSSLVRTDGTTTTALTLAVPVSNTTPRVVGLGGLVALPVSTSTTGGEVWKSDGTALGTSIITDFSPTTASSAFTSLAVTEHGALFVGRVANGNSFLYRTQGTPQSTNVLTAPAGGNQSIPMATTAVVLNGKAYTGTLVSDGLTVSNFSTGGKPFGVHDGFIYSYSSGVWRTDGISAPVKVAPAPATNRTVREIVRMADGRFIFAAEELYVSDGTTSGSFRIRDIHTVNQFADSLPANLKLWNGKIYFTADDGVHGRELWMTDGTEAGTTLLNIAPDGPTIRASNPSDFTLVGSAFYFKAATLAGGTELYQTDGTAQGTKLAVDVNPGPDVGIVSNLATDGSRLFFIGNHPQLGYVVYVSGGTPESTLVAADTDPELQTEISGDVAVVDGRAFFTATTSTGIELFATDGLPGGVVQVSDFRQPDAGGATLPIFGYRGGVIFRGDTLRYGGEPWYASDTFAPFVLNGRLDISTSQQITLLWNEDVSASYSAGDIAVVDSSGAALPPSSYLVTSATTPDGATKVNVRFSSPLPDGRYSLQVAAAAIADEAGNSMALPLDFDFAVLAGDANADGTVNFPDLLALAKNYNQSGRVFSQGDFNYDGSVSFPDLLILAKAYGTSLPLTRTAEVLLNYPRPRHREREDEEHPVLA